MSERTGWIKYIAGAVILALVGANILADLNDDEPLNLYQGMRAEELADMEAGATIKAKADAKAAFDVALQTCVTQLPDATCRAKTYGAARDAARKTLMDGGCVAWEMSEWDPTRGTAPRAQPKHQGAAEDECDLQADAIADQLLKRAR